MANHVAQQIFEKAGFDREGSRRLADLRQVFLDIDARHLREAAAGPEQSSTSDHAQQLKAKFCKAIPVVLLIAGFLFISTMDHADQTAPVERVPIDIDIAY